ncbi:MAG: DUF5996 family protein [Hyphomicrobiales bacterium]
MWPDIPYEPWRETCEALHLYSQIVGKYRLAHSPWLNHSWHATLYVGAQGLSTGLIPDGPGGIEVTIDLSGHHVRGAAGDGRSASFRLEPMSVAEFHERFLALIGFLGGTPKLDGRPNEVAEPIPFTEDRAARPYDAPAVERFLRALLASNRVLSLFRTGFLGKASPVHLFWGSFDLATTRFSGRRAPLHRGGIPALPDAVTREAYSHEVSSAGFWPGGGGIIGYPAFYSYAYPAPAGFAQAHVEPDGAFFHGELGEFLLPYEAVRTAGDPQHALIRFLETTYEAAAKLGAWDRDVLECALGEPLHPRAV